MGVNATKRILWKNTAIGDYAYITFDYQGNTAVRLIPRAKGVKLRDTTEMGGGVLTITVSAVVAKSNRYLLEKFFNDFDSSFTLNTKGDLKVSDENGTLTLTDCYLDSYTQSGEDSKLNTFTMKFVKSLA